MKIAIDKEIRRTILRWLQRGLINTDELPALNEARDNWFEQLLKEVDDEEPAFTRSDIERIEALSRMALKLKFPSREAMERELERLEAIEKGGSYGNM